MTKKKAFKLAAALESGKYRQNKGSLHKNGSYCCLGVACEIFKVPKVVTPLGEIFYAGGTDWLRYMAQYKTGFNSVSGRFYKEIKVKRRGGRVELFKSLSEMNDCGLSFSFIAKILRKHYDNIV